MGNGAKRIFTVICAIAGFTAGLVGGAAILDGDGYYDGKTQITFNEENKMPEVVIDPGHGGFDGGAVAKDGTVEKDLNLMIALSLKEIAERYPIKVIMTRSEDKALGPDKGEDMRIRKQIIEESQAEIAVSIHMNSYFEDESVCGPQVFYAREQNVLPGERTEEQEEEHSSKDYAKKVQERLNSAVSEGKERAAAETEAIYIMNNSSVNTILVECGFISNENELNQLKTLEYQQKIAEAIWEGINEILCVKKKNSVTVIDSKNIPEFV